MSAGWLPSVEHLICRLSDPSNAEEASGFPRDPVAADQPGLYSWWADDAGLVTLAAPFAQPLPALIYAGQAGATSTRVGIVRSATLRSRISGNHLNGNIGSSTFRRTLSAILFEPLSLAMAGSGRLDAASNKSVSVWMRQHLRLIIAPYPDRATLAHAEEDVLAQLDPPLNLMGMRSSQVRVLLSDLRAQLSTSPTAHRPPA